MIFCYTGRNRRMELDMDVVELIKQAWAAVQAADLPESIQAAAFRETMRMMSPQVYASPQERPHPPGGLAGKERAAQNGTGAAVDGSEFGVGVSEAEIYSRVAMSTGVDRSKLEQLVHLDGDTIKISLPGIKLGKNNADKTRAAAQILTVVRGFGLEEDDTSIEVVRAEAQRLKCYDSANFTTQLSRLAGFVITGSPSSRRIRAKAAGIAAFPALVDQLIGA